MATAEVCRRNGISSATFSKWKAKYGGLAVSEARKLRQLEDENARLKRRLADAMLDSPTQPMIRGIMGPWAMLKEIGAKKW
jgi:putative transposase